MRIQSLATVVHAIALLFLGALLLSACALTLPVHVQGQLTGGRSIILRGEATGYPDGAGNLAVRSEDGTIFCTGQFQYITPHSGSGVFNCSDGRFGNFDFTSRGVSGQGSGRTQYGEMYVFYFR